MTEGRVPLIAGNWKMNGLRKDAAILARAVAEQGAEVGCELLVCPPSVWLETVAGMLKDSQIALGGQDCHFAASGAHTGDISAEMLKDAGCRYVILGHSERRTDHGEASETVRAKAEAARRAGLTAIICVGETAEQRDNGETLSVVGAQLASSIPGGATGKDTVIAYEPVWAIGTGRTPTVGEVQEVHAHLRAELGTHHGGEAQHIRLLYGGSVKPSNAGELLALADVDGALVGGASLKADDFIAIAKTCP